VEVWDVSQPIPKILQIKMSLFNKVKIFIEQQVALATFFKRKSLVILITKIVVAVYWIGAIFLKIRRYNLKHSVNTN